MFYLHQHSSVLPQPVTKTFSPFFNFLVEEDGGKQTGFINLLNLRVSFNCKSNNNKLFQFYVITSMIMPAANRDKSELALNRAMSFFNVKDEYFLCTITF